MVALAIVLSVGVSTVAAYLLGARTLQLRGSQLWPAGRRVLESVGVAGVFFALNLSGWMIVVLGTRALTGWFISAYLFNGVTIGILSLLQGLTFHCWWESSRSGLLRS